MCVACGKHGQTVASALIYSFIVCKIRKPWRCAWGPICVYSESMVGASNPPPCSLRMRMLIANANAQTRLDASAECAYTYKIDHQRAHSNSPMNASNTKFIRNCNAQSRPPVPLIPHRTFHSSSRDMRMGLLRNSFSNYDLMVRPQASPQLCCPVRYIVECIIQSIWQNIITQHARTPTPPPPPPHPPPYPFSRKRNDARLFIESSHNWVESRYIQLRNRTLSS